VTDVVLGHRVDVRVEMDRQNAWCRCGGRWSERHERSEEEKSPQNGALQLVRILSAALRPTDGAGTLQWRRRRHEDPLRRTPPFPRLARGCVLLGVHLH